MKDVAHKTISPKKIVGIGAAGTLAVYCVYYFQNFDALEEQIIESGGGGLVLSILVLGAFAAFAGLWAHFCDAKTFKAAFTAGLSFPSMVFALGLGTAEDSEVDAEGSDADATPVSLIDDSFAMVFQPVERVSTARTKKKKRNQTSRPGPGPLPSR
jgi:hypothetical protein